ncbi:MAG: hypothetical protein ABIP53_01705 [Candidatus Limnocylindrales bacterium]
MRQQTPRGVTILIAALLVLIGVLGTFFGLIPNVAGIQGETIGVASYVAASLAMLAGIFVRGL